MTHAIRICLVAVAAATSVALPASAQRPAEFLTPAIAAKSIMDGRPWSAQTSDGRQMQATFNPDGTASMKGPMPFPMSATWKIKGSEICLEPSFGGSKCLRFRPAPGGFEGWLGDKLDLKLTR